MTKFIMQKKLNRKSPSVRSLSWICAAALIAYEIGAHIIVINLGKTGDINVNQSEMQETERTADDIRHHITTPISGSINPITRIYDKVARLNQLQRKLNGLPPVPLQELRPTSMQLQTVSGISKQDVLRNTENDLDEQARRLEQMLADKDNG